MKIAFDYQIFSQQGHGGISRYYNKLALEFSNLSEDISIFAGVHRNHYLSSLPDGIVSGYKLSKYPPKTGKFFLLGNQYLTEYQMKQWKPDLIHETYYSNYIPSLKGTPRVVTVYDMIHELYPKDFKKKDIISQRKRNACKRADHIISISHNTKKDLIEFFEIPPEKISVIHLGSDIFTLHTVNSIYSNSSKPFLLYVGPRAGYKNFNSFLEAISQSKKLIEGFDIVAFGGGILSSDEQALIHSLGFKKDQVRQVGGEDSVLASLYQEAIAFVYPSLYEGFGIPPLEAMACQCPVISSNTSSIPEVVGEAGEYFDPKVFESIVLAIENVVFSPNCIKDLKAKGLERIKDFSWQKCAQQTLKIYEQIVN
jgi:glycosyltransferase involved in cell wall biosynthesis